MTVSTPIRIVQNDDVIVMIPEINHEWRTILLDQAHTPMEALNESYIGESVGTWDGDTLVVDTIGIQEDSWLDGTGLPHSGQLQVVERIRKINGGLQLEILATIHDPTMFASTWTTRRVLEWRPDVLTRDFDCKSPPKRASAQATTLPKLGDAPVRQVKQKSPLTPDFGGVYHRKGLSRDSLYDAFWNAMSLTIDGDRPPLKPEFAWMPQLYRNAVAAGKPLNDTAGQACQPDGPFRYIVEPYPLRIVQTPEVIAILAEAFHQVRLIYLDAPHPEGFQPSPYGHAVGRWEGDTLIVDGIGFNDKTIISSILTPHSDALHLSEQYHLSDQGRLLNILFTIDDPKVFTEPWQTSWAVDRIQPTSRLLEFYCGGNERNSQDSATIESTQSLRPAANSDLTFDPNPSLEISAPEKRMAEDGSFETIFTVKVVSPYLPSGLKIEASAPGIQTLHVFPVEDEPGGYARAKARADGEFARSPVRMEGDHLSTVIFNPLDQYRVVIGTWADEAPELTYEFR